MLTNKAAPSTSVMPKYLTDGRGRDTFITFNDDRIPPHTNKACNLPTAKIASSKHPVLPKFIPSGNGRDMFCQVNEDKVIPHNGKGISSNPNASPRVKGSGVSRTTRPPTYRPGGSGRDLHYTSNDAALFSLKSSSFKLGSPTKIPRPRSSPPPKFIATGSGRDTYQNPNSYRPASPVREKDQGFAYGSSFLSKTARYSFKGDAVALSPKTQLQSTLRLSQSPSKQQQQQQQLQNQNQKRNRPLSSC